MATYLTVTSKGQVTLRKEVLEHLGVRPGDRIAVETLPHGKVSIEAVQPAGSIDDFIGCLDVGDIRLSIEEIGEIAADGWAGSAKRR